mmetsp:Transcript_283/g.423  ORF Transcript_283/g.423 Transcript_283/m.423 type:complete len:141 (+) Transcript_283:131-553(+)
MHRYITLIDTFIGTYLYRRCCDDDDNDDDEDKAPKSEIIGRHLLSCLTLRFDQTRELSVDKQTATTHVYKRRLAIVTVPSRPCLSWILHHRMVDRFVSQRPRESIYVSIDLWIYVSMDVIYVCVCYGETFVLKPGFAMMT